MTDVIVVGAGISGLSAAYRLEKAGFEVIVLERTSSVGGMIQSERTNGYLIERGPNSIQSRTPLLDHFVRELGLSDVKVEASEAAGVRYVVRNERPVAAPTSPTALFSSNLFGAGAKLRLMREPFVAAGDPLKDESVASFVRRRLGQEFLDYAINPFVGGVFAGDPELLSVKHTFPSLVELEQKHGSIIRGQIEKRCDPQRLAETSAMFSFRDGLCQLPGVLAGHLRDVRTNHSVGAATKSDPVWKVSTSQGDFLARAVICTVPLHRLDQMTLPDLLQTAIPSNVSYPPLAVVYHAYRREDVGHPLDGFGMLVPEVERKFKILGSLFTSSIFPHRAPEGDVLLTTFVGGQRHPRLASNSPDELHRLVRSDLNTLLRVRGEPTFMRHTVWTHAIPQYALGYDAVIDAIERIEEQLPGWYMAGNYYGGVSVGDAAQSGDEAAARCIFTMLS